MQKINPFLWFDDNAEAAMKFYTEVFPDAKITGTMPGPDGSVMGGSFSIGDDEFMTLNGGPQFKFNPAISFFVTVESAEEVDRLWKRLNEDGEALMPLGEYPFAEKYGWTADKFGVTWQVMKAPGELNITPLLMFTRDGSGHAEKAMKFYTGIFPDSEIESVARYEEGQGGPTGQISHAVFKLHGQLFMAMDGGTDHEFSFNEAISLYVHCADQAEVDDLWEKLLADGGEESQCGWLKDKFGVSWQIIPEALPRLMADSDRAKAGRVMQAMLKMKKINVAELEAA